MPSPAHRRSLFWSQRGAWPQAPGVMGPTVSHTRECVTSRAPFVTVFRSGV